MAACANAVAAIDGKLGRFLPRHRYDTACFVTVPFPTMVTVAPFVVFLFARPPPTPVFTAAACGAPDIAVAAAVEDTVVVVKACLAVCTVMVIVVPDRPYTKASLREMPSHGKQMRRPK